MQNIEKRNSILLGCGRICSTIGDSIYELAIIWYIYYLTNNTIFTGLAVTLIAIPQILNFLFGPLIDRFNVKYLLSYTQLFQFILMTIIPISIMLDYESVYLVLTVVFILSFLENFQGTSEMSIVSKIISKNKIAKYNSTVNSMQQIISMVSSVLFSVVILYVTIRDIYLFNAFTFLLAFVLFNSIIYNSKNKNMKNLKSNYIKELKDGWSYFRKSKLLLITFPLAFANLILSGVSAILPKYAEELGNSTYYGYLMFSISIGMLTGSLLSSFFMNIRFGKLIPILSIFIFVFWISSTFVDNVLFSLVLFSVSLIPLGIMNISLLTFTQITTEEKFMSRVLSISDSLLFISIPLGAMLGGVIGELFAAHTVMIIGGTSFAIISIIYMLNANLKRVNSINYYIANN
ncbi:MFS transporter [Mammaliicoccus stepanovicii]|uniref:Macrolide-efflux protein n=1 Tax=Mammaliicoccus stepanovicii TaxID=643214 RepID=A0A239YA74_9STAP|nr:MFS transporter [Mammaliicoccus stepanovicii]GGI43031.1 macrolide transporter [Mammaliicoccus stepanovicii]SNV55590.1 Macrolide-efflux protein [Mammaliicoccus stepanovicii]